jgi:nucleoid DNA-binding protein
MTKQDIITKVAKALNTSTKEAKEELKELKE